MSKQRITKFEIGERLDKVVSAEFKQYSRSALDKLIRSGDISVNGQKVAPKYKTKLGDKIEANLSVFTQEVPSIDLRVVYEDDDVVVINKPAGILTHAKGTLHNEATVATWLKSHVIPDHDRESSQILDPLIKSEDDNIFWNSNRSGIVHRLDRGTSGLIICAKNENTQTHLQKQFSNRKVHKTYLAIINGQLPKDEGLIDIPIERNPKKPATFRPGANGKSAQTEFKTLKTDGNRSLVELSPKTGRTHQLRVHLKYLKHPIVGDDLYGGLAANRMMLHAQKLELSLPSGERKSFEAAPDSDFEVIS